MNQDNHKPASNTPPRGDRPIRAPRIATLACAVSFMAFGAAPTVEASAYKPDPGTIGLVLTRWDYALVETPEAEECAAGLQVGEVAQFKAMDDHLGHLHRLGGSFQIRGPNGETANFSPDVVADPLPWRDLTTAVGYGLNLDGTQDGQATSRTCEHKKFTSPEGEKVDNQMARVVGCIQGFRQGGMQQEYYLTEIRTYPVNRHLIEITGIDDELNDPSVEVRIYKGIDQLVRMGGSDEYIPFQSHRIDHHFPQYHLKTLGRIVDGMLITEPMAEAYFPRSQQRRIRERHMRDVILRLDLTDTGASGMIAGYESVEGWWNPHSKSVTSEIGQFSLAGIHRALHRYADGYPDESGQCTFISTAYNLEAVRAIIIHPDSEGPDNGQVAEAK